MKGTLQVVPFFGVRQAAIKEIIPQFLAVAPLTPAQLPEEIEILAHFPSRFRPNSTAVPHLDRHHEARTWRFAGLGYQELS
jgi:hypothetical protein